MFSRSRQTSSVSEIHHIDALRDQGNFKEAAAEAIKLGAATLTSGGLSLEVILAQAQLNEAAPASNEAEMAIKNLESLLAASSMSKESELEARVLLAESKLAANLPQDALLALGDRQGRGLGSALITPAEQSSKGQKKLFQKGLKGQESYQPAHGAVLLLESLVLQAKCLHQLGKAAEAASQCRRIVDELRVAFPQGIPKGYSAASRVLSLGRQVLLLLPKLLGEGGDPEGQVAAYRDVLAHPLGLERSDQKKMQLELALQLLHGDSGIKLARNEGGYHKADTINTSPNGTAGESIRSEATTSNCLGDTGAMETTANHRLQAEVGPLYSRGLMAGVSSIHSWWDEASGKEVKGLEKARADEAVALLVSLHRSQEERKGEQEADQTQIRQQVWDELVRALRLMESYDALVKEFEALVPGVIPRVDRWRYLALAHLGAGRANMAMDLLRKELRPSERPNDIAALLLVGRLCSREVVTAEEGVGYGRRALAVTEGTFMSSGDLERNEIHVGHEENEAAHAKDIDGDGAEGVSYSGQRAAALHVLGVNLGMWAKSAFKDSDRKQRQQEAVERLEEAQALQPSDAGIHFDLAIQLAELRRLSLASQHARTALRLEGSHPRADTWRLLALILSAQQKLKEAEEACLVALAQANESATLAGDENEDEKSLINKMKVLRVGGKIQLADKRAIDAVKTYGDVMAFQTMLRERYGGANLEKVPGLRLLDTWSDLSEAYVALEQWADASECVKQMKELGPYEAPAWHASGVLAEAMGDTKKALANYQLALACDPNFQPSMVRAAACYLTAGGDPELAVARSLLGDALASNPTDHIAWYNLGRVNKAMGITGAAFDSFRAALELKDTCPALPFDFISRTL